MGYSSWNSGVSQNVNSCFMKKKDFPDSINRGSPEKQSYWDVCINRDLLQGIGSCGYGGPQDQILQREPAGTRPRRAGGTDEV